MKHQHWGRPLLSRPRGAFGSGAAELLLCVLSRPRIRSSRGRAGVLVGLDGCEVRLCHPCARVRPCVPCVSRLPGVFLPMFRNVFLFSELFVTVAAESRRL